MNNNEIKDEMHNALDSMYTSLHFETIWEKSYIEEINRRQPRVCIKRIILLLASVMVLSIGAVVIAENARRVDDTDVPFIHNKHMLGTWKSVGYVEKIRDFDPEERCETPLYLTGLIIEEGGKITSRINTGEEFYGPYIYWSGDYIISLADQTVSKCMFKKVKGKEYMFYEWKSGDYSFRGMEPYYYVLERVE